MGDTAARVRELETIRQFLTGSTLTVVIDLFFTVVFVVVLFFYSPLLTWIVLATLPAYALLSAVVTPIFRARLNEKFNRGAENHAFLVETVTGIQTVKAMAVEPPMQRRWEEQLAGYVRASFRTIHLANIAGQLGGLLSKGTTIVILWAGAQAVIAGQMTVGELIAFTMLASRVVNPVLRLVQVWQDLQQAGVSVARLGDVLNAPREPTGPSRTALPTLAGEVLFEQVTFRYQLDRPEALRQLTANGAEILIRVSAYMDPWGATEPMSWSQGEVGNAFPTRSFTSALKRTTSSCRSSTDSFVSSMPS